MEPDSDIASEVDFCDPLAILEVLILMFLGYPKEVDYFRISARRQTSGELHEETAAPLVKPEVETVHIARSML